MGMGIYTSLSGALRTLWERLLAAIGRKAAIKPVHSVCQSDLVLRFYDGFAADRG